VAVRVHPRPAQGLEPDQGRLRILLSVIMVVVIWYTLTGIGHTGPAFPPATAPPGSPAYCIGDGNDRGQGAIIDVEVDRDCPQLHAYRVFLYQDQQSYLQAGEPIPAGMQFPWCAVLRENPCVPTSDMTAP
jgi:hypothetical protein